VCGCFCSRAFLCPPKIFDLATMPEGGGYEALDANDKAAGEGRSAAIPPELLVVTFCCVATLLNVTLKNVKLGILELIAGRYGVQWILCIVMVTVRSIVAKKPFRPFGPPEVAVWLFGRGLVYFGFIWLWVATLRLVPVGDAVVVVQLQCFVTGIGANLLFGEKLTVRYWCCGSVALLGVVLVTRPPFLFGENETTSTLGMLCNLCAPLFSGSLPLFIKFSEGAHFMEIQHVTDFVCGVVCSPLLLLCYGDAREFDSPLVEREILLIAFLGITGLCLNTLAYQHGEASRMILVGSVEVPIAYAVQVLFYGLRPSPLALCGGALIVGSAIAISRESI